MKSRAIIRFILFIECLRGKEEEDRTVRPKAGARLRVARSVRKRAIRGLCSCSRSIIKWRYRTQMQVGSKSCSESRNFRKQKSEKPSKRNLGSIPIDPTPDIWKSSHEFYLIKLFLIILLRFTGKLISLIGSASEKI